jgi:drug/metabolite transporter (DMT)-like permease
VSVHLILLLAQVCFGSLAVAGRLALHSLPPDALVFARMTGGALAFGAYAAARGRWRVERRDVPHLALCALLGVVINQELFINGLARTTATNATVLGTTIPVFTTLFAFALGREPWRPRRALGVAVAFAGAAVLVGFERLSLASAHLTGSAMVLLNAASYGLFLVLVRPLAARYDPMGLVAVLFAFGVPMVAPLGLFAWSRVDALTARDVGFLAFLVAVPTVGAYALVQTALARAEASLVASYIYLQPVVTAAGAFLLLDERPGPRTLAAAALVFGGVWLSARARPAGPA